MTGLGDFGSVSLSRTLLSLSKTTASDLFFLAVVVVVVFSSSTIVSNISSGIFTYIYIYKYSCDLFSNRHFFRRGVSLSNSMTFSLYIYICICKL